MEQSAPESSTAEFSAMWRRQARWWHVAFAGVWSVVLVLAVVEGDTRRPLAVGAVLGVGAAYAVWGRRALTEHHPSWLPWAYLAVAWTCFVLGEVLGRFDSIGILFFVLFPQTWALVERAPAVLLSCAGTLGYYGGLVLNGRSGSGGALVGGAVTLSSSLFLGLFITHLVAETRARAGVIDELRATQERLAAAERGRGVSQERERLSREIHDTLAQGFTSIMALTRAADAALGRGDVETARSRLAMVTETAADNLEEARLIVAELTPTHLQSRTLVEALQRLVDATSATPRAPKARLTVHGIPEALGGVSDVVLLRTAQEALANARRHAEAARVDVVVDFREPDTVRLTVADDGQGFDPSGARSGFGLAGLQARAEEVGGGAEVVSAAGSGTTVRVAVPR